MDILFFLEKIWYWFNSIETYVITLGVFVYFIILFEKKIKFHAISFLKYLLFAIIILVISNFHPLILPFIILVLVLIYTQKGSDKKALKKIFLVQIILYYLFIFFVWGGLYSFISKDVTVPLRYLYLTLVTYSDTSANAIQTILMSSFITIFLFTKPKIGRKNGVLIILILIAGSFVSFLYIASSFRYDRFYDNPLSNNSLTDRAFLITVDGLRFDKFEKAKHPYLDELKESGVYYSNGIEVTYRAKTDTNLASIITGVPSSEHKVFNNFCCKLSTQALPDVVDTSLYGNVHVKVISKGGWDVYSVSPLKHYYDLDERVFEKLEEDLLNRSSKKLYIIDLGFVDQTGHTYGSDSDKYLKSIEKMDDNVGNFIEFLKYNKLFNSSTIIFTSEHGQQGMDHGFMIFKSEKFVPLIISGPGIKNSVEFQSVPTVLDLSPTISYLLGVPYTERNYGRVLTEIFN